MDCTTGRCRTGIISYCSTVHRPVFGGFPSSCSCRYGELRRRERCETSAAPADATNSMVFPAASRGESLDLKAAFLLACPGLYPVDRSVAKNNKGDCNQSITERSHEDSSRIMLLYPLLDKFDCVLHNPSPNFPFPATCRFPGGISIRGYGYRRHSVNGTCTFCAVRLLKTCTGSQDGILLEVVTYTLCLNGVLSRGCSLLHYYRTTGGILKRLYRFLNRICICRSGAANPSIPSGTRSQRT